MSRTSSATKWTKVPSESQEQEDEVEASYSGGGGRQGTGEAPLLHRNNNTNSNVATPLYTPESSLNGSGSSQLGDEGGQLRVKLEPLEEEEGVEQRKQGATTSTSQRRPPLSPQAAGGLNVPDRAANTVPVISIKTTHHKQQQSAQAAAQSNSGAFSPAAAPEEDDEATAPLRPEDRRWSSMEVDGPDTATHTEIFQGGGAMGPGGRMSSTSGNFSSFEVPNSGNLSSFDVPTPKPINQKKRQTTPPGGRVYHGGGRLVANGSKNSLPRDGSVEDGLLDSSFEAGARLDAGSNTATESEGPSTTIVLSPHTKGAGPLQSSPGVPVTLFKMQEGKEGGKGTREARKSTTTEAASDSDSEGSVVIHRTPEEEAEGNRLLVSSGRSSRTGSLQAGTPPMPQQHLEQMKKNSWEHSIKSNSVLREGSELRPSPTVSSPTKFYDPGDESTEVTENASFVQQRSHKSTNSIVNEEVSKTLRQHGSATGRKNGRQHSGGPTPPTFLLRVGSDPSPSGRSESIHSVESSSQYIFSTPPATPAGGAQSRSKIGVGVRSEDLSGGSGPGHGTSLEMSDFQIDDDDEALADNKVLELFIKDLEQGEDLPVGDILAQLEERVDQVMGQLEEGALPGDRRPAGGPADGGLGVDQAILARGLGKTLDHNDSGAIKPYRPLHGFPRHGDKHGDGGTLLPKVTENYADFFELSSEWDDIDEAWQLPQPQEQGALYIKEGEEDTELIAAYNDPNSPYYRGPRLTSEALAGVGGGRRATGPGGIIEFHLEDGGVGPATAGGGTPHPGPGDSPSGKPSGGRIKIGPGGGANKQHLRITSEVPPALGGFTPVDDLSPVPQTPGQSVMLNHQQRTAGGALSPGGAGRKQRSQHRALLLRYFATLLGFSYVIPTLFITLILIIFYLAPVRVCNFACDCTLAQSFAFTAAYGFILSLPRNFFMSILCEVMIFSKESKSEQKPLWDIPAVWDLVKQRKKSLIPLTLLSALFYLLLVGPVRSVNDFPEFVQGLAVVIGIVAPFLIYCIYQKAYTVGAIVTLVHVIPYVYELEVFGWNELGKSYSKWLVFLWPFVVAIMDRISVYGIGHLAQTSPFAVKLILNHTVVFYGQALMITFLVSFDLRENFAHVLWWFLCILGFEGLFSTLLIETGWNKLKRWFAMKNSKGGVEKWEIIPIQTTDFRRMATQTRPLSAWLALILLLPSLAIQRSPDPGQSTLLSTDGGQKPDCSGTVVLSTYEHWLTYGVAWLVYTLVFVIISSIRLKRKMLRLPLSLMSPPWAVCCGLYIAAMSLQSAGHAQHGIHMD